METLFVQLLCFAATIMLVFGIRASLRPGQAGQSLRPGLFGLLESPVEAIGNWIEPLYSAAFPAQAKRMDGMLMAAALRDRIVLRDVLGMQGLLGAFGFLAGLVGLFSVSLKVDVGIMSGLFLGALGWLYPSLWLARAAVARQTAVSRALPYALDLLTVAMQAGQDFGAAVRVLVREGPPGALRDEFSMMLQETELGKARVDALQGMAQRIQLDEVRTLVTAIVQSAEMGSSVTDTLRIQAEEIRRARFHKAERQAARAPSLMMIPVALFILPSVFIVILTPIVMKMPPMLTGSP